MISLLRRPESCGDSVPRRRNREGIFMFTWSVADTGCLLETHLVCQLENWSLSMGRFGLPLNMVPFFFFFLFNKKQQIYYSMSGTTPQHHLETSPSLLTCPQGYTRNGKNKSKPMSQLLLWKKGRWPWEPLSCRSQLAGEQILPMPRELGSSLQ